LPIYHAYFLNFVSNVPVSCRSCLAIYDAASLVACWPRIVPIYLPIAMLRFYQLRPFRPPGIVIICRRQYVLRERASLFSMVAILADIDADAG